MSTQPIERNSLPLKQRVKALLNVASELDRRGLVAASVYFADDHVMVYLRHPPKSRQLKGDDIRVVGGPGGLFQVKEKVFGIVHVQWVVPYVHLYVPKNGSIH